MKKSDCLGQQPNDSDICTGYWTVTIEQILLLAVGISNCSLELLGSPSMNVVRTSLSLSSIKIFTQVQGACALTSRLSSVLVDLLYRDQTRAEEAH